ncbi:trypsin delta-like [Drosophila rhopaloa]|uniref:trypsin n=1 Tax=Drosophila rhopaloa TaxID=1041015 RepID=A0A6P4EQJ9_DRORH|nr:trypsin delta-like [Drosophila rhopaloa]
MLIQWIFLISTVTLGSAGWIQERIVGGHLVPISAVPWQAALLRNGTLNCGAVIYSDQILITAAHCLSNNTSELSIRVGSSIWNYGGQVLEVAGLVVHKDFRVLPNKIVVNDIAVIRVKSSLKMGRSVRSIPLANSSPKNGSSASVSGWGRIGFKESISDSLLEATVDIVDQENCQESYGKGITKELICAAAQGKDSCSLDSGGPLVSGGKLVGIVSFGEGCGDPNYPGVYVNVAELKPWILKAIKSFSCPCTGTI